MLSPAKDPDLSQAVLIAIESAVSKDHFYRRLHQLLGLSFVRALVADCFARADGPSSIRSSSSISNC